MRPDQCRLTLRPRDALESVDLSLVIIREMRGPLFRVSLGTVLPIWLVCCGMLWVWDGHGAVILVPLVLGPVIQAPLTVMLGQALFAGDVSSRFAWTRLGQVLLPWLTVWVAVAASLLISALSFFALWPLLSVALTFSTESVLLERVSGFRALHRSARLGSRAIVHALLGNAIRVALWLWLWLGMEGLGKFILVTVLQFQSWYPDHWELTPFGVLGMLVSQVVWTVVRLMLYIDVRTRTEGWDLQVGMGR